MSIAIPYLAILALIMFLLGVVSAIYFFIHIYTETLKIPLLSAYAIACYNNTETVITIVVRLERGEAITLRSIQLTSEKGLIDINTTYTATAIEMSIEFVGFRGMLRPGQVGRIALILPLGYYVENKTYHAILFFDKTTAIVSFEIMPCTELPHLYSVLPTVSQAEFALLTSATCILSHFSCLPQKSP